MKPTLTLPALITLLTAVAAPAQAQRVSCAAVQSATPATISATSSVADRTAREAIQAALRARSDYDRCRHLARAIDGIASAETRRQWYAAFGEVGNEFEIAELLIASARGGLLVQAPDDWFASARRLESPFELRRVLTAALEQRAPSVVASVLATAPSITGEYELASLLVDVARRHALTGGLRDAYVAAASRIRSEWEHSRAMRALATRESGLR